MTVALTAIPLNDAVELERRKLARMTAVWHHFAAAGVCAGCCCEIAIYVTERDLGDKAWRLNGDRIKACGERGLTGRRGRSRSCAEAMRAEWKAMPKMEIDAKERP